MNRVASFIYFLKAKLGGLSARGLLWSAGAFIENDLKNVSAADVYAHIRTTTNFSFSFVILLIASTVVVTLGLLLNSAAVVIGGMIIAPLMWPLIKVAGGITYGTSRYVFQAVFMLFLATSISLSTSALITYVSPIKVLNSEILARTNPTLLDVFIAFAAGSIAALAMAKKKISDSLAGVAIATSLMPPLCVSGIGFALGNKETFLGGFLLYLSNIVSIIFISIITFSLIGAKSENNSRIRRFGLFFVIIMLVLTSIPLFILLKKYSFQTRSYQTARAVLENRLKSVSPVLDIENIRVSTEQDDNKNFVLVTADVLMPEDITINYLHKQEIVDELEKSLSSTVELRLLLQRTISLEQKEDKEIKELKSNLGDLIVKEMPQIDQSLSLDSMILDGRDDSGVWLARIVFRGDPSVQLTAKQQSDLEKKISAGLDAGVKLDIEILPRIKLKSDPDIEADRIKQEIRDYLSRLFPDYDVLKLNLTLPGTLSGTEMSPQLEEYYVALDLIVPGDIEFDVVVIESVKQRLQEKFNKVFHFNVNILEKQMFLI